jgi:hypothetical protein
MMTEARHCRLDSVSRLAWLIVKTWCFTMAERLLSIDLFLVFRQVWLSSLGSLLLILGFLVLLRLFILFGLTFKWTVRGKLGSLTILALWSFSTRCNTVWWWHHVHHIFLVLLLMILGECVGVIGWIRGH